ncbi:helix-turn-helix domain-containing protein [Enterococcus wangshanyuanii]|uniref:helix-turn-helix domain-containing protein n=1 Tax=Enterococcus wangshanyuanii TaxID=2005703 RepID=UPI0013906C49|nr:helix-turn-helix transcriptional regulator [Enterococcus wangshanyuanii]
MLKLELFRGGEYLLFNSKIIRDIRKEFRISQVDLYKDILSRSSYYKLEKGEKDITIGELSLICERLRMRPSELLYRTDFTRLESLPYWENKINLPNLTQDRELFFKQFNIYKKTRFDSIGDYSLYLGLLVLGILSGLITDYMPSKKHLRSLEKMYSNRKIFFAIDYEVLGNLTFFLPQIDINFMTSKMFPITQSEGEVYDLCAQNALKNLISSSIHEKKYDQWKVYNEYFDNLRSIEHFNISTTVNLEVVYLEHLKEFYETRDINAFLEASKIANLFLKLGYKQIHKLLVEEISKIAINENFQIPKEIAVYTQAYSIN